MSESIAVVERATDENFSRDGYLLANVDVKNAGVDPQKHFQEHGRREGRSQITAAMLGNSEYRRSKFEKFRDVLSEDFKCDSFPAVAGASFDLSSYVAESANNNFGPFIEEIAKNPAKLYLDLGCGLRPDVYENCLYLEVYPSVCADIIAGTDCTYPIKDNSLDGIGCFAVLEHTRQPWKVVAEMQRMLKPGGKVFIDWPFLQPVHGFPSHYFNATREGLRTVFEDAGFKIDTIGTWDYQSIDFTINWVLGKFVRDLPKDKRKQVMKMRVGDLIEKKPYHDKFWRDLLKDLPDSMLSEFACGNTLLATKI